jgi:hypothetical protein
LRLGCLCVKLLLAHCGSFHLSSLSCYIVSPYTARYLSYLSVLSSIIWKINSKTVSNSSVGRTVIRTRILYRNILRFDFKRATSLCLTPLFRFKTIPFLFIYNKWNF